MGAVANLAPELFAGIVAEVPFVDALTTILDPSLPLTVIEWDEWGNPLEDPEVYAYMKSYSPYENVADQRYPAILAETSPQRHPGALRRAGQVGGPAAGDRPDRRGTTSCSRPRWRPGTAGSAAGTTPGASGRSRLAWILDRLAP